MVSPFAILFKSSLDRSSGDKGSAPGAAGFAAGSEGSMAVVPLSMRVARFLFGIGDYLLFRSGFQALRAC